MIVDSLASEGMHGRGYVSGGDKTAAAFIRREFIKSGIKSFHKDYFQTFSVSINTFPDTMTARIDDDVLVPGREFVVLSSSPGIDGTFGIVWQMADTAGKLVDSINPGNGTLADKVVVTNLDQNKFKDQNPFGSKGIISLMDQKVWWHVSNGNAVSNYFRMQVLKEKLPESAKKLTVHFRNQFLDNYPTQNVVGYVEGSTYPDSFFIFTAHYDHLGMMGSQTWFPGANDNASGTALLLDLARYYSLTENKPEISVGFMAFGAEEAGLAGSGYYTGHPLFPLEKISFLVNLDMVGSGSEGIKVVNGTVFTKEFEKLKSLNKENEYLLTVSERGEAANSDHYPFYARGVPCFFIYTLGSECKEYHNIFDTPENVPFTEYNDLFSLLVKFQSFFEP
jgi:hypothetical protein